MFTLSAPACLCALSCLPTSTVFLCICSHVHCIQFLTIPAHVAINLSMFTHISAHASIPHLLLGDPMGATCLEAGGYVFTQVLTVPAKG